MPLDRLLTTDLPPVATDLPPAFDSPALAQARKGGSDKNHEEIRHAIQDLPSEGGSHAAGAGPPRRPPRPAPAQGTTTVGGTGDRSDSRRPRIATRRYPPARRVR